MWWKVLLLALYLLLVFLISRFLEVVTCDGKLLDPSVILDPFTLSVRKLKQILENRGVSYVGVLEKNELCHLVDSSGHATENEIEELENHQDVGEEESPGTATTHFTCGSHFNEEVEDKKDSIWIVQVVSEDGHNMVDDESWNELTSKLRRFGIRTGLFDCNLDRRFCARKSWFSSQIILALPSSARAKQDVSLHHYPSYTNKKALSLINWIGKHLAKRIAVISSLKSLERDWLNYKTTDTKSVIRVVFVSPDLSGPPLFMSALSGKFSGRVKFGIMKENASKVNPLCNRRSGYLIITPEGVRVYSERRGEILSYRSLEFYLKSLAPEMNDMFVVSLLVVNSVIILELFFVKGKIWKHIAQTLWNVARYNCSLFLLWILVIGLFKFEFMNTISEFCLTILRKLANTDLASSARDEWKNVQCYPATLIFFYVLFCMLSSSVWKKTCRPRTLDDSAELFDWLTGPIDSYIMNCFFRPMATLTRPMVPHDLDLEEGMELLIERLAVPNLWLQPMIPSDYLKDLPVWKYNGWCLEDDFESSSEQISSDDEISPYVAKYCRCCLKLRIEKSSLAQQVKCCSSFTERGTNCRRSDDAFSSKLCSDCRLHKLVRSKPERCILKRAPPGMLECRECSICLEKYRYGVEVCGLPCGHSYHMNCIMLWLLRDNHCCPICRWPSYKPKPPAAIKQNFNE